jgi:hypothetical protein
MTRDILRLRKVDLFAHAHQGCNKTNGGRRVLSPPLCSVAMKSACRLDGRASAELSPPASTLPQLTPTQYGILV